MFNTKEEKLNHYEILKVAQNATLEQISKNYYLLLKKNRTNEEETAKIILAFSILGDAAQRQAYDDQLNSSSQLLIRTSILPERNNNPLAIVTQSVKPVVEVLKASSEDGMLKLAETDENIALTILDNEILLKKFLWPSSLMELGKFHLSCALKIFQEKKLNNYYLSNFSFYLLYELGLCYEQTSKELLIQPSLNKFLSGKDLYGLLKKHPQYNEIVSINASLQNKYQSYLNIEKSMQSPLKEEMQNLRENINNAYLRKDQIFDLCLMDIRIAKYILSFSNEISNSNYSCLKMYEKHLTLINDTIKSIPIDSNFQFEFANISIDHCSTLLNNLTEAKKISASEWSNLIEKYPRLENKIRDIPEVNQKIKALEWLTQKHTLQQSSFNNYISNLKIIDEDNHYLSRLIIKRYVPLNLLLKILNDQELIKLLKYNIGSIASLYSQTTIKVLKDSTYWQLFKNQDTITIKLACVCEEACKLILQNKEIIPHMDGKYLNKITQHYKDSKIISDIIFDSPDLLAKLNSHLLSKLVITGKNQVINDKQNIIQDGADEYNQALLYFATEKPQLALKFLTAAVKKRFHDAAVKLRNLPGIQKENSFAEEKFLLAEYCAQTSIESPGLNTEANSWYFRAVKAGWHEAILPLLPLLDFRVHSEKYNFFQDKEFYFIRSLLKSNNNLQELDDISLKLAKYFLTSNIQVAAFFYTCVNNLNADDSWELALVVRDCVFFNKQKEMEKNNFSNDDLHKIMQHKKVNQYCLNHAMPYYIKAVGHKDNQNKVPEVLQLINELLEDFYVPSLATVQAIQSSPHVIEAGIANILGIHAEKQLYEKIIRVQEDFFDFPYLTKILAGKIFDYKKLINIYQKIPNALYDGNPYRVKKIEDYKAYLAIYVALDEITLEQLINMPGYLCEKLIAQLSGHSVIENDAFFKHVITSQNLRFVHELKNRFIKFIPAFSKEYSDIRQRLENAMAEIELEITKQVSFYSYEDGDFLLFEKKLLNSIILLSQSNYQQKQDPENIFLLISVMILAKNDYLFPENYLESSIINTTFQIALTTALNSKYFDLINELLNNEKFLKLLQFSSKEVLSQLLQFLLVANLTQLAKIVIENGAEVNPIAIDDHQYYPLQNALDKPEMLEFLIQKGAQIQKDLLHDSKNKTINNSLCFNSLKTLLYYTVHRTWDSHMAIFNVPAKNNFEPLELLLVTGLLKNRAIDRTLSFDGPFLTAQIKTLNSYINTIFISYGKIKSFFEDKNNQIDVLISYVIYSLLEKGTAKYGLAMELLEKTKEVDFKFILKNKVFFTLLRDVKISNDVFLIFCNIVYHGLKKGITSIDVKFVLEALQDKIQPYFRKNPEIFNYFLSHSHRLILGYLFKNNFYEQGFILIDNLIEKKTISEDEIYLSFEENENKILLLVAFLEYWNKVENTFSKSQATLLSKLLSSHKSTFEEFLKENDKKTLDDVEEALNNVINAENPLIISNCFKQLWLVLVIKLCHSSPDKISTPTYFHIIKNHSDVLQPENNFLEIFIKKNNQEQWQCYLEKIDIDTFWNDYCKFGNSLLERKNALMTLIPEQSTLSPKNYWQDILIKIIFHEISHYFSGYTFNDGKNRKDAIKDMVELLHELVTPTKDREKKINELKNTLFVTEPNNIDFSKNLPQEYLDIREYLLTINSPDLFVATRQFLDFFPAHYNLGREIVQIYNSKYNVINRDLKMESNENDIIEKVYCGL